MAQVRGSFPGNIDNVEKEVYTLIGTTLKAEPSKWRKTFRVLTSEGKSFERRQSYAMFGSIPLKGEGEDYSTALINPGPRKDFTHLEFGGGFEWTKTAQEDDRHDVLSEYATGLARAARFTEETYAARLHNLATSSETTPDGQVAYYSAHTLINGGTFSNIVAQDLSRTSLEAALTLVRTDAKSDEGHFMEPPDGWFLEVPPALEFIAHRLVKSNLIPGSADNDTNATKDRYSIEVLVNPFFSDTDSWRIVAKNKLHGMLSYTRVPIGMEKLVELPRSGNLLAKIRFRRSWGYDRAQGIVGSMGA